MDQFERKEKEEKQIKSACKIQNYFRRTKLYQNVDKLNNEQNESYRQDKKNNIVPAEGDDKIN